MKFNRFGKTIVQYFTDVHDDKANKVYRRSQSDRIVWDKIPIFDLKDDQLWVPLKGEEAQQAEAAYQEFLVRENIQP